MKPAGEPTRTTPGPESDEAAMERFLDGDAQGFDVLFERFVAPIRAYLTRTTGSGATADDLTQLTFLSVVRGRGRFQRGARVKPWLYAIATNAARDWMRRGKFEAVTDDGALPDSEAPAALLPDPALEKLVRAALAQLPEAQREAIVLHRFEGLSYAEIAATAGVTETAIKVRAHRGSEKLRELLKGAWEP